MTSKLTPKLTRAQAELVLKRAAELESARQGQTDDALEPEELERLGQEVGLSPQSMTQALAELDRGQLASPRVDAIERLFGEPLVQVSRWVPRSPARVDRALARFMSEQLMVIDRQHGERIEWVRPPGLFPGLSRSVTFADRYSFGPASRVETLVVEDGEGSFVNFRIEMGAARKLSTSVLAWRGLAVSSLGALLAQGVTDVATALSCLGASGLGVGAFWWGERRRFSQLRERVSLGPERFLDGLSARGRHGRTSEPRPGPDEEGPEEEEPSAREAS